MTIAAEYRVAVVTSHPIQYQAPWFRALARLVDLHVFFAHRASGADQARAGFGVPFEWDVDLLDGYASEWVDNVARRPGLDHFLGCNAPALGHAVSSRGFHALVVTGWNLLAYWQAIRAARRSGIPVLVRGDSQLRTPRTQTLAAAKRLAYPRMLRAFDGFLVVGRRNEEYYREYGVGPERLYRSPHSVDNDFFAAAADAARLAPAGARAAFGIDSASVVFVFAGKLVPMKRPLDFVAAIDRLAAAGLAVHGLIVGDGPLRSDIEAHQRLHGTPLTMTGFLNQRRIASAYAAADALALPSTGAETWGLVVNEAMAAGVPAVVSDACGCAPDLIQDGVTGFTYPVGDVAALADRLRRIATIPAGRRRFGEAAAGRIRQYSPAATAEGVVAALRALRPSLSAAPV